MYSTLSAVLVILIALIVAVWVFTLIHELGHLATALFYGFKVKEMRIFEGPKLFGFTWRGIAMNFHLVPGLSYVLMDFDPMDLRGEDILRYGRVAFAGPYVNLIVAALISSILPKLTIFAIISLAFGLANLLPFKGVDGGQFLASLIRYSEWRKGKLP